MLLYSRFYCQESIGIWIFILFESFIHAYCIYTISTSPPPTQYPCVPSPNLLGTFSIAFMFRDDHLRLDKLSGSLSLEKTDSYSLSSYCLPVDHHLEVESSKISFIHIGMSTGATIMQV